MPFYNYHEYRQYNPKDPAKPIVVTHFPNVYPDDATDLPSPSRVVRVPRLLSSDYPQFSTCIPGREEAALNSDHDKVFVARYQYSGHWFGTNSLSPLTLYLTDEEFAQIVKQVNTYLEQQYQPTFWSALYILFDILTLGLLLALFQMGKKPSRTLEDYIDGVNLKFRNDGKKCRIVSPRLSGYLSLDFVIPEPVKSCSEQP